jgi:protein SCO1/2
MQNPSRRNLFGLAALPFAGQLLKAGVGDKPADASPDAASVRARESLRRRYFPDVVLYTQENRKVRFYEDLIKDKIVVINVFYAECDGSCPRITANLVKVQKLLGDRVGRDIFMYSLTLKPEQDTPRALKEYAAMYNVRPGWSFLTGKPKDAELLRRCLGFTDPDPKLDQDKSQHIGNIKFGNERYMLWSACPGMAHAEWIVKSIGWMDRTGAGQPDTACCEGKS